MISIAIFMFKDCFPPGRWLRHMATVPKGFLRYQVLELLNEKPMSGSEIMSEIERRTVGCWRPSPGSIYPLLAWLQDNGYIIEAKKEETGIKRYTLTEKGRQFLEEQRKMLQQFSISRKFFVPPFISSFLVRLPWEETKELREAFKRLFKVLFNLGFALEERFSEQALREILQILNEASQRLENIEKKLREGT
ncbi:MAG: PadR family transcriptional regulator [Candidatus Methanomethyliaceae archaeon]|nr:PadR family transcriptional regulator [Candidatus Methanomethyliaceae archaeon]MDW7970777.1 PadR family transcriptional regulator [Nitrososphaerota archaeon]